MKKMTGEDATYTMRVEEINAMMPAKGVAELQISDEEDMVCFQIDMLLLSDLFRDLIGCLRIDGRRAGSVDWNPKREIVEITSAGENGEA